MCQAATSSAVAGARPMPGALVAGRDADVRRLGERADDRHVVRASAAAGRRRRAARGHRSGPGRTARRGGRSRPRPRASTSRSKPTCWRLGAEQRRAARRGLDDHRDLQRGVVGLDGGDVAGLAELAAEPNRRALEHDDLALAGRDRDGQAGGPQQRRASTRRPRRRPRRRRRARRPSRRAVARPDAPSAHDAPHRRRRGQLGARGAGRAHQRGGREPRLELGVVRDTGRRREDRAPRAAPPGAARPRRAPRQRRRGRRARGRARRAAASSASVSATTTLPLRSYSKSSSSSCGERRPQRRPTAAASGSSRSSSLSQASTLPSHAPELPEAEERAIVEPDAAPARGQRVARTRRRRPRRRRRRRRDWERGETGTWPHEP